MREIIYFTALFIYILGYTKREPEIYYPRRPGYGKAGRQINLRTNFFQLILPPNDYLFHYDVTIEPAALKSVQREIIRLVYEKYGGEAFGKAKPAYDGSKNLYTMKDLPVGKDGVRVIVVSRYHMKVLGLAFNTFSN